MYLAQLQSRTFDYAGLEDTVNNFSQAAENSNNSETLAKLNWIKGRKKFDEGDFLTARSFYETAIKMYLQEDLNSDKISDVNNLNIHTKEYYLANKGNICILQFEIAKTYEFTEQFDEGLKRYLQILEIIETSGDKVNLGSSYHHIAFCLCSINRVQEGINYYNKSIVCFAESGQYEYLGNSISDLGRLAEKYLGLVDFDFLKEDFFDLVLQNFTHQIMHFIKYSTNSHQSTFNIKSIPLQLIGKIVLTIQVAGFSQYKIILSDWAQDLYSYFNEKNIIVESPNFIVSIINLAHAIGGVQEWKVEKEVEKKMMKSIYQNCLIINGGPDINSKTRIFYWLALWVNYYELAKNETAEALWNKAWNSFDN